MSGDRTAVDGLYAGCDTDFLMKRLEVEPQRDVCDLIWLRHDRLHRGLETLQFGGNRAGTGRHLRKPEQTLLVREVVPLFTTPARQRDRHTGHDDRSTVGRR